MQTPSEGSRKTMLVLLKQAVLGCGIVFSTFAGMLTSANTVTQNEEGLTGILVPGVPDGLGEDDFAVLDGNWAEWSAAAAADVEKLYGEEPLSLADQRAALDAVADRVDVMEIALADPAYAMIHKPLSSLHGKLKRRLDIATAAFETLQLDPNSAKSAQIDDALRNVLAAQAELSAYLKTFSGGQPWLAYLGATELGQKLDGKSADETLQILSSIEEKIENRSKLESEEQQQFLGAPSFLNLADAIDAYRTSTNIPVAAADNKELRAALADLVAALEGYESTNSELQAEAARAAFEKVTRLAPDGGDLVSEAMRAHYFNYNLHVVASEKFLDKIAAEERFEDGPVDDYILGAKVDGSQRTRVLTGIDVVPSADGLRFKVVANGHICSNTQGVTDQATVYTSGNHCFTATKEVHFNWEQFVTEQAQIGVNANNNTYDASTKFDGIPLLGAIGRSIAKNEARKKRPQSQAIARGRIADRVLPRFESEGEEAFAKANEELHNEFYPNLKKANIYPSAVSLSSSDSALFINTRGMEDGELAGSRPNTTAPSNTGATVEVHESAVNNMFDRVGVAGKTLTEDQVAQLFSDFFETAFGRKIKAIEESEKPYEETKDTTTLIFAERDPLRVKFEGDQVILTIRAGLKREGEDDIPTQEITVGIKFTVEGNLIIAESIGDVTVSPVEKPESLQLQIARAGVIRQKIAQALPRREIDGAFDYKHQDSEKVVLMNVTEVGFLNGWLRVVVE